jgi:hypothetical protein
MATVKKTIKKAQAGTTATKDSTAYFQNKAKENFQKASDRYSYSNPEIRKKASEYTNKAIQAQKDELRQANKGKKGYDKNGYSIKKNGGAVKAKDGKWIQKAVNPKHKGFCTPMTKATCTPKRKALAKTFKAMAKKRK